MKIYSIFSSLLDLSKRRADNYIVYLKYIMKSVKLPAAKKHKMNSKTENI